MVGDLRGQPSLTMGLDSGMLDTPKLVSLQVVGQKNKKHEA